MALSDFFNVKDRPAAFRILPFFGIFRDEEMKRFGFVYGPPKYVENLAGTRNIEVQDARPRMPRSLLEQIELDNQSSKAVVWPLGDRFKLARTLAQCLYVLHAAGWVHKKYVHSEPPHQIYQSTFFRCWHTDRISIRSSSILFLPQESSNAGTPSSSGFRDMSKPYLCGFGHSRPGRLPSQDAASPQHPKQSYGQSSTPQRSPSRAKTYWNITLDQYHHPAKRVNSLLNYIQAFDLYS